MPSVCLLLIYILFLGHQDYSLYILHFDLGDFCLYFMQRINIKEAKKDAKNGYKPWAIRRDLTYTKLNYIRLKQILFIMSF